MTNFKITKDGKSEIVSGFILIEKSKKIIDEEIIKNSSFKYKWKKKDITNNSQMIKFLEQFDYKIENEKV